MKDPVENFWRHVMPEPNCGCWIWTGRLTWGGYGQFFDEKKKLFMAHRIAYKLFKDENIDGLQLDHLCRMRCCVNPDHLEPVTAKENNRRGGNTNREKKYCSRGHELTLENTYKLLVKDGYVRRKCRACNRIFQQERRDRARA
jgi:hypothetical protein